MIKRACVTAAITGALIASATGVASAAPVATVFGTVTATASVPRAAGVGAALARPVPDPVGTPYCGPGRRWEHGHCRSKWLQVAPSHRLHNGQGWFAALVPLLALGAL